MPRLERPVGDEGGPGLILSTLHEQLAVPPRPSSDLRRPRWAGPCSASWSCTWQRGQMQRARDAPVWPGAQAPQGSGSRVGDRPAVREHCVHVQLHMSAQEPPPAPRAGPGPQHPRGLKLLHSRVRPWPRGGDGSRVQRGGWLRLRGDPWPPPPLLQVGVWEPGLGRGVTPGGPSTRHALTAAPGAKCSSWHLVPALSRWRVQCSCVRVL